MDKQGPDPIDPLLQKAFKEESRKFQESYLWLEQAMPPLFFEEVSHENRLLIAHALLGFSVQDYFSTINLKHAAIVLCLNTSDADLRILKDYAMYGIRNYQTYVSKDPIPRLSGEEKLRIALLYFTGAEEERERPEDFTLQDELRTLVHQRNPNLDNHEFQQLLSGISNRFLRTTPKERLILALDLFFRAKTRDNCQYEVRYDENWEEKNVASMHIVLAWRNTPKHHFLYRMARIIHRHGLTMRRVNANYIDPYGRQSILVMVLSLHGADGKAAWDVGDIPDFLRELVTVKYFASFDDIDKHLVSREVISGSMGNFLRATVNFIHQMLVHIDPYLYTLEAVMEAFCRHPELTTKLCEMVKWKFDPNHANYDQFVQVRTEFLHDLERLDTGHEAADHRRKTVLQQGANLVTYLLKTNFYRYNYTAISFRLDPKYLDEVPFDRKALFPELPYAIFFVKGMHFIGFHIRFKDLARGGLRTVYPKQTEHLQEEMNRVFLECYQLARTQHAKNKDIPEGGAKGILFLKPFERLTSEAQILEYELEIAGLVPEQVEQRMSHFREEQLAEYLHQAQRSYIESFITLLNCDPDGALRAKNIVDYWKNPEYIYLGPDENMHDSVIRWIANFSKKYGYKPGGAFISGKPGTGINHKKYGVTSLGVNVFMHHVLEYCDIDPKNDPFTVKMTGGPDGDVAGNQIKNLFRSYPKTAHLVAVTDGTGTIYDPEGLDLEILVDQFAKTEGIRFYPPERLSDGGFLLDKWTKRQHTAYAQQTVCYRKEKGRVIRDWLSGSEMNALLRLHVHQTPADVFIPAGGRPRTLHRGNIHEFLDATGKPTAKAIIEGANLYLTPRARDVLEEKGVLIVKDSSANKTGVICSSFEVLAGLTLSDEEFSQVKPEIVKDVLFKLEKCAYKEAVILLQTHQKSGIPLTQISDEISHKMNQYMYEILENIEDQPFPKEENHPFMRIFFKYALPVLRERFQKKLLSQIPDSHKNAIVASYIASQVVYTKGLDWSPTIVNILPVIFEDESIMDG